jgi:hypothetical protein
MKVHRKQERRRRTVYNASSVLQLEILKQDGRNLAKLAWK